MKYRMKIATDNDISELYELQILAFESEAEMIGSREVPALKETKEHNREDFANWITLKLVNESDKIIGAIRYREQEGMIEIGRLMVHPEYRQRGFAMFMISEVDKMCPNQVKELYTCSKSWKNLRLYEKMGFVPFKEVIEGNGLSFVYMRKM